MKVIPLIDLRAQYVNIESEIDDAVKKVLASGRYILGPEVAKLETEIANLCGCKYGLGVASGTDALILSLKASGIGPGDEVITSAFSFIATASAILHCGAKVVFVDIDPLTFNINPELIEEAITARTKAIIPVHLYGQPADMNAITEISKRHRLIIIEDAAQSLGARWGNKSAGQFGLAGCISFFPSKNLGCCGDGGMVVTDNPDVAERVDMFRRHGCKIKYHSEVLGYNSRLDELQAAILRVKLRHLNQWNRTRREIAFRYNQLLKDLPIVLPYESGESYHVYHQYTIRVKERDQLALFLKENGIETGIYYPTPLHLQKIFKGRSIEHKSLPVAEEASHEVLSLPIYPELTIEDQIYIRDKIKEFFATKLS